MKSMTFSYVVLCFVAASAYKVPVPEIQLLPNRGFQASIPDETGVQFFTFNGNINKKIRVNESGLISGEVYRATSGRWVFQDVRTIIRETDVLWWWIHIQVNGKAYRKSGSWNRSTVNPTAGSCRPSVTTCTTQQGSICQGQLILEENFDYLNSSIWSREILIPAQPNYEFSMYHNHPESVKIENGILEIIPSLLEDSYGEGSSRGSITLAGCTSHEPTNCNRTALAFNILPPIISARLTTRNHFNFRYGRVEIRAKFPEGDWLYPELLLEPKNPTRNPGSGSVRIRLGMTRGNRVLTGVEGNYGGRRLEFGLRGGLTPNIWNLKVQKLRTTEAPWTSDFHVYTTTWNADGFLFQVDGEEVGALTRIESRSNDANHLLLATNRMAQFDGEFYITLGVGVGGVCEFPDHMRSGEGQGYGKPWRNVAAKGMLNFWQAKDQWLPSWQVSNGEKSHLKIDYIRVYAV